MALATGTSAPVFRAGRAAFWIKWIASVFQVLGNAATAFALAPWNIHFFLIGLAGWLTVGLMWRDRAIVLIHLVALGAMGAGLASG